MPDADTTINSDAAGSSPEAPVVSPGGELISTVEFRNEPAASTTPDTDKADKTDDKQTSQAGTSDGADAGKETKDGKDQQSLDRFDQHPRFRELISKTNDLTSKLTEAEARIAALSKSDAADKAPVKSGFEALDDTAIFEKLNNNPKEFLNEFASRIKEEALAEISQRASIEQAKSKTISDMQAYAEKYADTEDGKGFDQMWNAGEIHKFIAEHPGHNAISAHQMLTGEHWTQKAINKAVAEAVEKTTKQFQAKRNAGVLSGGPAASVITGGQGQGDLADTKINGGLVSTLAARLQRMRNG
jgi:hypothetical protein